MTLEARIEAIARKLEDPEACEWSGNEFCEVSPARFWFRWRVHESGDWNVNSEAENATAGWLIERLIRVGFCFERLGKFQLASGDRYVVILEEHETAHADALEAVVEAAERALGIAP